MMAKDLVSGILGAVELGANVAGVPFAAGAALILKEIVDTCDQLRIHKKKARTIRNKCVQFTLLLDDHSRTNIDAELLKSIDETRAIFERVYSRMHRYSQMSAWSLFLKMSEIGEGLDECEANVQSAIEMFQFAAHAVGNRNQQEIKETMRVQHEEMRALLREVLTKPSEAREIIAMQRSGSQVAQQVMQAGQEQLRNELMISNTRSESPTREGRDQEATTQKRRPGSDIRDALYQFHLQTGTLPAIKILNEEITRRSDHAVAGGTHSDIWEGLWLGRKKVALKGLRNIKADDPKAKLRIEREIKTWSSLQNEHILPFYGIVTDIGTHIHMVSPWQENGNVLDYLKKQPNVNRLRLIKGAARGLAYLHSMKIVHGNVKCTNILVMDNGEACICDFGMSKLIEEVTEKAASATLTAAGSARWLAPELIDGTISSPTFATDTYSFAMAVLELLTGKYPFAERKRDASVIHDVVVMKQTPARPQDPRVCVWLTDELWNLLGGCWHNSAESRPTMAEVTGELDLFE